MLISMQKITMYIHIIETKAKYLQYVALSTVEEILAHRVLAMNDIYKFQL